MYIETVT